MKKVMAFMYVLPHVVLIISRRGLLFFYYFYYCSMNKGIRKEAANETMTKHSDFGDVKI